MSAAPPTNTGVLRLRCVDCGEFLARDAAAAPESHPSRADPDACAGCAGEVPVLAGAESDWAAL